jgi:hypothetical protein
VSTIDPQQDSKLSHRHYAISGPHLAGLEPQLLQIIVRQNEHVYLACVGEKLCSLLLCNMAVRIVNDKILVGDGAFLAILSEELIASWPRFFKGREPLSQSNFDPIVPDIANHSPLHVSQCIWMFPLQEIKNPPQEMLFVHFSTSSTVAEAEFGG